FPRIFGFLQKRFSIGDYSRGKEYTVFTYRFPFVISEFSVLICFEDIFPSLVRKFVQKKAEFLINITEDGWYGKSLASFQHMQSAVFRAIENRRFVVRVANTGYSCVINPQGKIVSELKDNQGNKLFITGIHTAEVIPNFQKTFYSRWGDGFVFLCIIITILIFIRKILNLDKM
ncbi:MAG: apolipoprotein N-acyltransferase, partial [Candidatus Omnitrophota bacterium]